MLRNRQEQDTYNLCVETQLAFHECLLALASNSKNTYWSECKSDCCSSAMSLASSRFLVRALCLVLCIPFSRVSETSKNLSELRLILRNSATSATHLDSAQLLVLRSEVVPPRRYAMGLRFRKLEILHSRSLASLTCAPWTRNHLATSPSSSATAHASLSEIAELMAYSMTTCFWLYQQYMVGAACY